MNVNELKSKKAELKAAAERLINAAMTNGKDLAGVELEQYNGHVSEIKGIEGLLARHAEMATFGTDHVSPAAPAPAVQGNIHATAEYRDNFLQYLRTGDRQIMAALNITTPASGGYAVPQEFETQVVERLQNQNVMRQISSTITTAADRNITIENNLGVAGWTAEAAVAQNDAGADDNSFSRVTLKSNKLTRIIKVSEELLLDSMFDLQGYLARKFGSAFAAAEEAAFVVGTGTGQPRGVTLDSSTGITTAGPTAIVSDELLGLYHSLKRAYRANGSWLMNDSTALAVRKLKDSMNNYLWQPGLQAGMPDVLLGRPVYISDAMPVIAALAKTILFGDFSYYQIADRAPRQFVRLNELYAANGQVGFRGVERTDGILTLPEAITTLAQHA
jgi:HK97 family phage major capsid protein